jgi:hypothetical protein
MNLLIAFLLILFKAIPDAVYDRGYKTLSKYLRFWYDAGFYFVVFLFTTNYYSYHGGRINLDFWYIIFGALLLRWALFDLVYNLIKKSPIFYVGTTDPIDKIFGWFFRWSGIASGHFLFLFKLISLAIGITWLLK